MGLSRAHTRSRIIRLIAEGRYSDAYMINWRSNVFPGILGRTCDRPCEPACRRGRVEETPVAICRLKRVAADFKDDVKHRMPRPSATNGKRIAIVGGGPASLTVARDLAPLGYQCVVFDSDPKAGGMMRTQISEIPPSGFGDRRGDRLHPQSRHRVQRRPAHRQPEEIAGRGFRRDLYRSGAPRGRELEIPGRKEAAGNVHIGIDWLASCRRPHRQDRQARDCARRRQYRDGLLPHRPPPRRRGRQGDRAFRLRGDEGVTLGERGRHSRGYPIVNFMVPIAFTHDSGKLTGVTFQKVKAEYDAKAGATSFRRASRTRPSPATTCWWRSARRTRFRGSSATAASSSTSGTCPRSIQRPWDQQSESVLRRRCGVRSEKHHLAVAHGHDAALSIHKLLSGADIQERPLPRCIFSSQKMGIHEWSYDNDVSADRRYKVPHRDKVIALRTSAPKLNSAMTSSLRSARRGAA